MFWCLFLHRITQKVVDGGFDEIQIIDNLGNFLTRHTPSAVNVQSVCNSWRSFYMSYCSTQYSFYSENHENLRT